MTRAKAPAKTSPIPIHRIVSGSIAARISGGAASQKETKASGKASMKVRIAPPNTGRRTDHKRHQRRHSGTSAGFMGRNEKGPNEGAIKEETRRSGSGGFGFGLHRRHDLGFSTGIEQTCIDQGL